MCRGVFSVLFLVSILLSTVHPLLAVIPASDRSSLQPIPDSVAGIELPAHVAGVQSLAAVSTKNPRTYVRLDKSTGAVTTLIGDLAPEQSGSAEEIAVAFVADKLGLPVCDGSIAEKTSGAADRLVLTKVLSSGEVKHVTFTHTMAGVPVRGEEIAVHVTESGRVTTVTGSYHPAPASEFSARITAEQAIQNALTHIGSTALRMPAQASSIWVPVAGQLRAAYQVSLASEAPLGDFEVAVAADTGKIIGTTDHLTHATGEGKVYNRSPLNGDPISVSIENLNGSGKLVGAYVSITNAKGAGAQSSDLKFNYEPTDTHFDEVLAYYNVNRMHDYFKALGFNDRDKPIKVTVHYGNKYDNAFFSPMTDSIALGDGNKLNDLSQEDNVVMHEYTHAVNQKILSLSGDEGGAMGEGYSDYFAGSINDSPLIGEWTMKKMGKPWLRNMTNTKHYPEDIQGEVHADGDIWGGVCWDLRKALGQKVSDMLLHKGRYYIGSSPNFVRGLEGTLAADKNVYSGQYADQIKAIFAARGIKPSTEVTGASSLKLLSRQTTFGALLGSD